MKTKFIILVAYCLFIVSVSGQSGVKGFSKGKDSAESTNKFKPSGLGFVTNKNEQKIDAERTRKFWGIGCGGCGKKKCKK